MLSKLNKLSKRDKLLFINAIDSILFARTVDRIEVSEQLMEILVVAECTEKEIKDFLEQEFKND